MLKIEKTLDVVCAYQPDSNVHPYLSPKRSIEIIGNKHVSNVFARRVSFYNNCLFTTHALKYW